MLFLIGQPFKYLAVIQLHALSLLQKTVQIRDEFFLYMDPVQGRKMKGDKRQDIKQLL